LQGIDNKEILKGVGGRKDIKSRKSIGGEKYTGSGKGARGGKGSGRGRGPDVKLFLFSYSVAPLD